VGRRGDSLGKTTPMVHYYKPKLVNVEEISRRRRWEKVG